MNNKILMIVIMIIQLQWKTKQEIEIKKYSAYSGVSKYLSFTCQLKYSQFSWTPEMSVLKIVSGQKFVSNIYPQCSWFTWHYPSWTPGHSPHSSWAWCSPRVWVSRQPSSPGVLMGTRGRGQVTSDNVAPGGWHVIMWGQSASCSTRRVCCPLS